MSAVPCPICGKPRDEAHEMHYPPPPWFFNPPPVVMPPYVAPKDKPKKDKDK